MSQDFIKDVIIVVNEDVNPKIESLKISAILSGDTLTYKGDYTPGRLVIYDCNYGELKSASSMSLSFNHVQIDEKGSSQVQYSIDDFKWYLLDSYYLILYFYDTDLKRYKKLLEPIEGKSFTYEYDSPEGSMRRVRLK